MKKKNERERGLGLVVYY